VSAPKALAGRALHEVRTIDWAGSPATLLFYGRDLGGVVVIEHAVEHGTQHADSRDRRLGLPTVAVGGARGEELATPLGTLVSFERGGVSYTVLGSVASATVVGAARSL
jgi:hypothetical protein